MVGNRRRAREAALQLLYQAEFHTPATRAVAERWFWQESDEAAERQSLREFAVRIVSGVREQGAAIDERIRRVARNWKIERMSRVDRNILRMATFELVHLEDIPPKVSLNEAIEIAKAYGTEDSSAFINGILDRISRDLQKGGGAKGGGAKGGGAKPTERPPERPPARPDDLPNDPVDAPAGGPAGGGGG